MYDKIEVLFMINDKSSNNLINFEENISHGSLLKPFAKYHTDIGEILPFYPIHWHKEMEIMRVQSGAGSFSINGDTFNASAGDIIFMSPYANHSMQQLGDSHMSVDAILFDIEMLIEAIPDTCSIKYFSPLISGKRFAPIIMRPSNHMYHSIDQSLTSIIFSVSGEEVGYELSLKANLMWLFYHLYRYDLIKVEQSREDEKSHRVIKTALEYIKKNYSNNFSIADLAKACGYSDTYLMKLFKKYTGMTCVDYINSFRLNEAGQLLMSTNDQIIDIAIGCGYSNISYFNKLFKETYGMTPKEFRKEYAK